MDKISGANAASGLSAAMERLRVEIGAPPDAEVPRARQLPLIPTRGAASVDPGLPDQPSGKRGPGRPPGAPNKSTQEWRDYILARYPSPLQALAEIMSRPTLALAKELGCKPLDALKAQLRAAEVLAPYTHSKMPVAIELDASGIVPVVFNISPQLGDLINAAGGDLGNRGPFKVIDHDQGKSTTYGPSPDEVGQSEVGQDGEDEA